MRGYTDNFFATRGEIARASVHGPAIGMRILEERAAREDQVAQAQIDAARFAKWSFVISGLAFALALGSWFLPHPWLH
jgi:hypothetical protein